MKRRLWILLFAFPLLSLPASHGQTRRAVVHPLLEPVLARPYAPLPKALRGTLGGRQGKHLLPGRGEALDLILRTSASRADLEALGIEVRTLRAGIATVTAAPADLPALAARRDVSVITLPQLVQPAIKKAIPDIGIAPLRAQSNGVFSGATGKNVIVGVIDSGIDFDHPNFTSPGGSTRILYLWDQVNNPAGAGVKPAGFNYGTEWTAADIGNGIVTEQDDVASFGHGTHVTGIAAGNGAAADEDGAFYASAGPAPESQIIFVKTNFQSDGIIDAMEYIFQKADALGLPCVINLSIESSIGSHTGTNPMEQSIDALVTAKPGRAVVVAAGNFRSDGIHAETSTAQGATTSVSFSVPSYAKQANEEDFVLVTGYYAASDTLSVQLVPPVGNPITKTLGNGSGCGAATVTPEGTIQICHGKKSSFGDATLDREISIYITDQNDNAASPPKAGTWQIKLTGTTVTSSNGADFWLLSDLGTNKAAVFNGGLDEFETVSIPGTSREAITVGAYATRLCWTDHTGTPQSYDPALGQKLNDIAFFSGIGPTRDNRFKPDLAAPGFGIVSSLAHEVKNGIINAGYGYTVINDDYLLQQGTSQATPLVTGAVALLLEKEPGLTGAQVKSKLASAARADAFTNAKAGIFGLNVYFGAGKLDLGSWAFTDPNETNDTASQATLVLSGQSLGGFIDRAADVDLFDLQGVKGGDILNVTLTNLPQDYALSLQGTNLIVFSQCGSPGLSTITTSNNPGTANESISFNTGGIQPINVGLGHYLRVTSPTGVFDEAAGYQIKGVITRPEQGAAHGTILTAQALPDFKEIKVSGAVSVSGEKDDYSLTINNFATLTVTNSVPLGTILEILDKNGAVVASSSSGTVSYQAQGGVFGSQTLFVQVRGQVSAYTLTLKKP